MSVCFACSASASRVHSRQSFSSRNQRSCSSAAATAALAMCLMVSGHLSTQTCSFSLTGKHAWCGALHLWSAHQALASLVVRSFRRTVFAPALPLCLRDLDLLLDDLHSFLTHLDGLPARCWILS